MCIHYLSNLGEVTFAPSTFLVLFVVKVIYGRVRAVNYYFFLEEWGGGGGVGLFIVFGPDLK